MAGYSQGSRRVPSGSVPLRPPPIPSVIRIERPANDNFRPRSAALRVLVLALGVAGLLIAAVNWMS